MTIPPAVLAAYPDAVRHCRWVPLPPGGGLSGGRVWRGEVEGVPLFALKRWPVSHVTRRLADVHERMRQAAALDIVPKLVPTLAGTTFVVDDRCWDVTTWMPGTACFSDATEHDGISALRALGTLHRCWRPAEPDSESRGAAVKRHRCLLSDWKAARINFSGPLREVRELNDAAELIRPRVAPCEVELEKFTFARRTVTPLHGDYWPENVLFIGHRVSALLDFGNTHHDFPEVDVARFIADLPPLSTVALHAAAEVYESANPGVSLSVPLLDVLISSGRVCSLARWLLRVNAGEVTPADALPRVRRLVSLLTG